MAIVWWENFEWATTSTLTLRCDELTGAGGGNIGVVSGPTNGFYGRCLRVGIQVVDYARTIGWSLGSAYSEGLFSFAISFISAAFTGARPLFTINTGGVRQIVIRMNTDGTISALRNTTLLGTSTAAPFQPNLRHRVEIACVCAGGTSGSVIIKVNGVVVLDLPGVNTANSGTTFNRFVFSNMSAPGDFNYYVDDIWFDTDKTAFIGDQTIALAVFTSDVSGVSTPSSGSDRFAMIDETPADLTDYTDFASTGEDVYEAENMTVTPTSITGLGILYLAQKTDTGTVEFRSRVLSGSDYANGTTQGLNVANYVYTDFFPVDPATGIAWTESGVNGMRPVLERIS